MMSKSCRMACVEDGLQSMGSCLGPSDPTAMLLSLTRCSWGCQTPVPAQGSVVAVSPQDDHVQ